MSLKHYKYICKEDISLVENYELAKADNFKGRHWFTNGVENKFCFECPEGFVKGLTKNKEII